MRRVAPGLHVGGIDAAGDPALLAEHGITAVVKLSHARPDTPYPDAVTVADHPLLDGPQCEYDAFRAAVADLAALLAAGRTVLVHCSAGASRSGAVAAAGLARSEGIAVDDALARIRDRKPDVRPHSALLDHARRAADG